ncbi:hypothetical protein NIES267_40510 [Calothrix parasitica NIES-267]|uniref:Uncharacterized protein n=1 Tax=Calothrix parasitica NIES-267 TaxID=1973488 RepID=A0A1Z4LTH8_9CYAN|nr:hypothetical protein NIES267_40510 [Calothrix parasitica NIES-267]
MQFQHQQQNHIYQNNQHPTDDFDESWVPNPHGQVHTSAATPGLINLIGSKNLDSLLTNPWLMSMFVATVILVVIAAIATTLSNQSSSKPNSEQEAYSALLQKSQNLEAAHSNFREYLTRNDYSSGIVSNPGLLQAVVLEASARYRNSVIAIQNQKENPAYNQHEEVINLNSEIEALKRINLGASGKEAELKYVDPSTGSWVTIPIDSAELAASGLVKLNIISNSRRETTQRFNLVTIAQNTRLRLDEVKAAMLEALRVKGLNPVASELEKTDWFGKKESLKDAQISNYQTDEPEPIPATPLNKQYIPEDKPSIKPKGGNNAQ